MASTWMTRRFRQLDDDEITTLAETWRWKLAATERGRVRAERRRARRRVTFAGAYRSSKKSSMTWMSSMVRVVVTTPSSCSFRKQVLSQILSVEVVEDYLRPKGKVVPSTGHAADRGCLTL
jgi:hypothetical protein